VADGEPAVRAILLGASNLRAGLPAVLDGIRRRVASPVEVLAACGHGRSYGSWSRFLFARRLPGIAECGLWPALEGRSPLRTLALVTDVGNDLVYGAGVERIAGWIETCLDRLARQRAEIVLTLLPIARLERLSAWGARLATSLLFPGRAAPWPALLGRARQLDEHLRRSGRERGARLLEPEARWYGVDPIHPRRSARREAWERILSLWPPAPPAPGAPQGPPAGRIRIPPLGAAEVQILGITLRHPQPAVRMADGTTVALY
jgi:hypothetical protein